MKKAFSLFELSIVILIISVIIAGVTQSSKLVKKSRLASAQTLTKNSIVNNLDNLVAWYETSLDSSFIEGEAFDGGYIRTWRDNNPQAINKNDAVQANDIYQPIFYENIFNSAVPALRFDGTDVIGFDCTAIANNPYTIFVVEQRRSNDSDNYFIGGTVGNTNQNLILGYRDNTTVTQAHYGNDLDAAIAGYTTPIPRIHTFTFDSTNGKNYYINGTSIAFAVAQTDALTDFQDAAIGRYNSSLYHGDFGEIIIFKTKLKSEDRKAVEIYLSKKYGITIS